MKLAIRLAQAYPKGGPGRRAYVPGGPLFARRPLKFRGVKYAKNDALPASEMTPKRHLAMFRSGLADHAPRPAKGKAKAGAVADPLDELAKPTEEAGLYDDKTPARREPGFDVSDSVSSESALASFRAVPGEAVHVRTPEQQRRGKRR
ncbi:MAG TPA: hypothetical protein VM764_04345 [Gemmatimonadaceae bacterium]|nr:hypothetical protein [Gemmatimonadaceae bacterium]